MSAPNFKSDDFYEVLGVPRDAQDKDIKKAYRKLSLKYHPDKNPDNKEEAEEIFKTISFAYGILSDSQKRQDYDRFGRDYVVNGGHTGGGGGGGANFRHANFHHFNMQSANDIFRNFFGGKDPFQSFFDDEDDFFGGGMGGMGGFFAGPMNGGMAGGRHVGKKNRDPFGMGGFGMGFDDDDDFFGGNGFSSMNMMSSGGGGGGFTSF